MNKYLKMKLYAALLFAFVLAVAAIGNARADYGRINKFLKSKVDSDEVGPNLAAAVGFLKSVKDKHMSFVPGLPVSDLEDFTALQQVIDDNKCDGSVDDILSANEGTIRAEHVFNSDGRDYRAATRRVDRVVMTIVNDYTKKCEKVRLNEYLTRKEKLAGQVAEQVDTIAKAVMEAERGTIAESDYYQSENLFDKFVRYYRVWLSPNYNVFRSALMTNAKDDPDVQVLRRKAEEVTSDEAARDKIKKLVEKYLVAPCLGYVRELGPGLFIPARHSVRVFETIYDRKSYMNEVEYYLGWSKFTICEQVVGDKETVLNHVLKSFKDL